MRLARSIQNSQGFTLIELMTVIVIIGIMTAMIIPEMKGTFEDALLRSTARELINTFELASSRSVSLNQNLRLELDTTQNRYVITRRKRAGRMEEFLPLEDVKGSEGQLDKRISLEIRRPGQEPSGDDAINVAPEVVSEGIQFHPDGTADAALVLLKDREGFQLGLRINPITGRVRLIERERE